MFGFRGFTRNHQETSQPVAAQRTGALSALDTLDTNVELVSKEDIYRIPSGSGHPKEPILLLKKGHAVDLEELPRYIRHGVQPEQFQLRYRNEKRAIRRAMGAREEAAPVMPEFQRVSASPPQGMQNPMLAPETPVRRRQAGKRVLVMDIDQRSMKRLIDCLFVCGIPLDRIQPLRLPQHLDWALEKHQPDILIIDYRFRRDDSAGLDLLQSLATLQGAEQIILALDPNPGSQERLGPTEEVMIRKLHADGRIAILPKPVSRFALSSILNSR